MNASKAKGTTWETEIKRALVDAGWRVYRNPAAGSADIGDIGGLEVAGIPVVVEAKAHSIAKFPAWLRELEKEMTNRGTNVGVVWAKRKGSTKAADGYVVLSGAGFMDLLGAWDRTTWPCTCERGVDPLLPL